MPQFLRPTVRVARRNPGFVGLVVVILALGIGASTAAMNVAASVLHNPLPVYDDSRLVFITKSLSASTTLVPFSYAEIGAWRDAARTLEHIAGVQYDGSWPWAAEFDGRASTVTGTAVSGNFFETLGMQAAVGRLLREDDGLAGAEVVAVIGYAMWRREFAGNPGVVGQMVRLDGQPARIVGVAPKGFAFPDGADVWRPLDIAPDTVNEGWFSLVARLKPGATVAQAAEDASELLLRLRAVAQTQPGNVRAITVPFRDAIVGDVRPVLVLFVGAAALLFLVACFNVANLILLRGTARQQEITLRAALGGTRGRLIRELMTESASLAAAGGILGLVVAYWLQRALIASAPVGSPRLEEVAFDGRTLAFAAGGSIVAAGLAGVAPVLWTVRQSLFQTLRSGPTSAPTRTQLKTQVLISLQLAFALAMSMAAALLVKSLVELQRVDLGFSPDRLTAVQVPLLGTEYRDPQRRRQFFDELVSRMEALPGVAAATPVLLRPFTGTDGWDATLSAEGQEPEAAAANPGIHLEAVLPNYFSTMGISVRRGRSILESDREGTLRVVVLAESLARRLWPGSDGLGKRVKFGPPEGAAPWMTVVGVVADLRYRDLDAPPPAVYIPLRQAPFPARFLLVRTRVDEVPVLNMAQRTVRDLDADEPVVEAAGIGELLRGELAAPRFRMFALGLFALLAIVLASVGVFGILAAFVAQRSRELGIRAALGATRSDLRKLVLTRIGWPTAVGLSLGTSVALAAGPLLEPLLFRVSPADPSSLAAAWLGLGMASLVASVVPLRRAERVDPVTLLRFEQ